MANVGITLFIIDFAVFKAVIAVVPTFATEFNTVVEKFASFPMALANSFKVSKAAGDAPTKFEIALLTYVWLASCDEIVELILVIELFNVEILDPLPLINPRCDKNVL